jgi:hypothetical protein
MALGIQIPAGGPFIAQASTCYERNGLHDHLSESHTEPEWSGWLTGDRTAPITLPGHLNQLIQRV